MNNLNDAEVLNTGKIYIDKNVIFFKNRFISAQNISMVSMYKKDKDYSEQNRVQQEYKRQLKDYHDKKDSCSKWIFLGILSFVIMIIGILIQSAYVGVIAVIAIIIFIYLILSCDVKEPVLNLPPLPPDEFGIIISLNSTQAFRLESSNEQFIRNIAKTLLECINQEAKPVVYNYSDYSCQSITNINIDDLDLNGNAQLSITSNETSQE